jgi:hypothetical protein
MSTQPSPLARLAALRGRPTAGVELAIKGWTLKDRTLLERVGILGPDHKLTAAGKQTLNISDQ